MKTKLLTTAAVATLFFTGAASTIWAKSPK